MIKKCWVCGTPQVPEEIVITHAEKKVLRASRSWFEWATRLLEIAEPQNQKHRARIAKAIKSGSMDDALNIFLQHKDEQNEEEGLDLDEELKEDFDEDD